jgi:hypothetical protein
VNLPFRNPPFNFLAAIYSPSFSLFKKGLLIDGTCESGKARVDVTVGISTLNITNTFTPNGDGINDYWKINNIENYPNAVIQVFTRYGQKIFESKGYQVSFDGYL